MRQNLLANSIKIVLAPVIGILIALRIGLDFPISAGTVAILTIQPTKRETIQVTLGRLYAFAVALVLSSIIFKIFGVNYTGFLCFLALFIFVCQLLSWKVAMVTNIVLISHFVSVGEMSSATIRNEIMIFFIGATCGIIANLHLRKRVDYIEQLKRETDEQIVWILHLMSKRVLDKDIPEYNEACFNALKKSIRHAKNVAEENYNNQFKKNDKYDIQYIAMRDRQYLVLYEMYKCVRQINTTPHTANTISDFLKKMSLEYGRENDGKSIMKDFHKMDMDMKSRPLPMERKEFEDRARLFYLMRSIEEFIEIKMDFARKTIKTNKK